MEYFVCKWPHWHQNTCTQIFVTFFVVFMGGKDNIYNTTKKLQACFFRFQITNNNHSIVLFHLPPPTILRFSARLLARQSWSFDGSARRRPCAGINTSRPQHVNRAVPGRFCVMCPCSVSWWLRLIQDDGIKYVWMGENQES